MVDVVRFSMYRVHGTAVAIVPILVQLLGGIRWMLRCFVSGRRCTRGFRSLPPQEFEALRIEEPQSLVHLRPPGRGN